MVQYPSPYIFVHGRQALGKYEMIGDSEAEKNSLRF